jgi:uncharacterized protein (TIRG00374 family)
VRRQYRDVKRLWLVAGFILGAAMLAVAAKRVDLDQVQVVLRDVSMLYAGIAVAATLAFLWIKAWRWSLLLSPLRALRAGELLSPVCIGTAANMIVPHAGELARVFLVSSRQPVASSALLASIVVERMLDFGAVLTFLGLVFLAREPMPAALTSASMVAAALFVMLLAVSFFALYRTEAMLKFTATILKILPQNLAAALQKQAETGVAGLASLRHAHVLAKVALVSLLLWFTVVVITYASVRAVGVEAPLAASIVVLVLMVVGLTLPAAPVYVGTTQLAFTIGLAAFGVGAAHAFAASVVYTVFGLLPMLVAGGIYFLRHRSGNGSVAHAG